MPTLHWIGKEKVINHHQEVPFRVLEKKYTFDPTPTLPDEEGVIGEANKIIHGDNLEALKALLPQYEGKIKCIYIDPPYNTGNEGWVYNDNVNDPKIKRWLGQVVGKESEDLSRHDKWLCMMYPRLKLLHKLLADDGAIFISIDDNEQANLKLMMDEIFGSGNFIGNIIWQHSIQGKNDAKTISLHHNSTFVYKKANFQIGKLERTEEHNVAYSNPDNDPEGDWRSGDFRSPNYRENLRYNVITPSGKVILPPEKGWRWEKGEFEKKVQRQEIIFNSDETKITRKIYLKNQEGRVVESIWFGKDVGTTREANTELKNIFDEGVPFDTPKPTKLLERIIQIATNKDDLILDSFAGSGTTAHAVLNLNKKDEGNRKFILIEMEDYAETITAERVKRVIAPPAPDGGATREGTGGSFSFYTLGERLFDEENNLNEAVGIERIREYVWFTETRNNLLPKNSTENDYFLGKNEDTAYYFYYEPSSATVLGYAFLESIKTTAQQYVIYADNCTLSDEFLTAKSLIFKKIPRDITRF